MNHQQADAIRAVTLIGKRSDQWPILTFTVESSAVFWLNDGSPDERARKHLYRVEIAVIEEVTLTEPVAQTLRPVDMDTATT